MFSFSCLVFLKHHGILIWERGYIKNLTSWSFFSSELIRAKQCEFSLTISHLPLKQGQSSSFNEISSELHSRSMAKTPRKRSPMPAGPNAGFDPIRLMASLFEQSSISVQSQKKTVSFCGFGQERFCWSSTTSIRLLWAVRTSSDVVRTTAVSVKYNIFHMHY